MLGSPRRAMAAPSALREAATVRRPAASDRASPARVLAVRQVLEDALAERDARGAVDPVGPVVAEVGCPPG